ncbi:MAG: hypothetical protein ABJ205_10190 [Erythrobacter sp.]|uniref:hypothetical protein n=1 Tax=Erythrobacter sp. TaxID=1042 RepID=UPI00326756A8
MGANDDVHIDEVAQALKARGAEHFRFDIYNPHRLSVEPLSRLDDQPFSVIWRRLKPPFILDYANLDEYYHTRFVIDEWRSLFAGISLSGSGIKCVNSYASEGVSSNKLRQLGFAAECGFRVPKTLCSNDPDQISAFIAGLEDGLCIQKPLTSFDSPTGRTSYTRFFTIEMANEMAKNVRVAPSLYQEYISSPVEWRVTVVGKRAFAAAIQKPIENDLDWRRSHARNEIVQFELDKGLKDRLLDLHQNFGLHYGAYDFMLDGEQNPVFLEVNPVGQWLWIEKLAGLSISEAIADLLIQESTAEK